MYKSNSFEKEINTIHDNFKQLKEYLTNMNLVSTITLLEIAEKKCESDIFKIIDKNKD